MRGKSLTCRNSLAIIRVYDRLQTVRVPHGKSQTCRASERPSHSREPFVNYSSQPGQRDNLRSFLII